MKEKWQPIPQKYCTKVCRKYYKYMPTHWTIRKNMDKFLETYNLPRLNQEETENLNRQIITNKIDAVIKKLPTNKSPGQDGFTGEFYQTFKGELINILLKLFQKIQ